LWFLFLPAAGVYYYFLGLSKKSFYVILMLMLYCYVGLSYVVLRFLERSHTDIALWFLYFIFSGVGLVFLLINVNRKIKQS
jgi:hypothetical protein